MGRIERVSCGNVNCFLIIEGENAVLVDTGREKHREKVLAACQPYKVGLIVLTHGHVDHAQNAAYLSERLGAPVGIGREDVALLRDNLKQRPLSRGLLGKMMLAVSLRSFGRDKIPPFTPVVLLRDGDSLEEYGVLARIISLPGHTEGSIGIDVEEKALIVGDALMNMFFPTVSLLYGDEEKLRASAAKIGGLGQRQVFFGHGEPVSNRLWV